MKSYKAVFNKKCEFIAGVQNIDQIPVMPYWVSEVAFVGRSNVGKSSLINAVVGVDGIARVSKTPGRTQQINFFSLNGCVILADLPGYGFAAVSKQMRKQWDGLILSYLVGRQQLRRAFLLVDSRRGLMASDSEVMRILDEAAVSYQIVLTKADDCKDIGATLRQLEIEKEKYIAVHPEVIITSSTTGAGIDRVRGVIMDFINERG